MLLRIALLSAVLFALPVPARAGPAVFVNELHYDNSGPDTDEAVEIAGPALTNLNGWSVVLYNGTGGAALKSVLSSPFCLNYRARRSIVTTVCEHPRCSFIAWLGDQEPTRRQ